VRLAGVEPATLGLEVGRCVVYQVSRSDTNYQRYAQ